MKTERFRSAVLVGIVALIISGIVWGSFSVAEVSAAAKARRAKKQNVAVGQVVDEKSPSEKRQDTSAATRQAFQKRNRDGSCGECDGTCPFAQDGGRRSENRGKSTDSATGTNKQERKRDGSANGEAKQERKRDGSGAGRNQKNGNQNGNGTGGNQQRKRDGSGNGQGSGVCPFGENSAKREGSNPPRCFCRR